MDARDRIIATWVEHARAAYTKERAKFPTWPDFDSADHGYRKAAEQHGAEFADGLLSRRVLLVSDEARMSVELAWIVLSHNDDPNDTDVIGTVIDLLDWLWRTI